LAAEQKARVTYEHLIVSTDDRGVKETLGFLREREVVHFQRFGEALRLVQEHLDSKKYY
jgi:spore coat protein JC